MSTESQLREKLRKIEALFAGAGTSGEAMGLSSPPHSRITKRGIYATGFGIEFWKACISK
jgi:hypothetical protein